MSNQKPNDVTRRDALTVLGAAAAAPSPQKDPHDHNMSTAAPPKTAGPHKPKSFNAHDYQTLRRLCELIVPAEPNSPGALEAGAPEYIDLLCTGSERMKEIYLGGLAWMDRSMEKRAGKPFVDAKPEEQLALLDLISYRKNDSPDLGPGIRFFDWVRRMTVDAYYTSAPGIKDVGYMGNKGQTNFKVPQEAIDHVMKRSPLG